MKPLYLSLVLTTLLIVGCSHDQSPSDATPPAETSREAEIQTDSALAVQNILSQSLAEKAAASGKFVSYEGQDLAGTPHVVFFHANWCSWCRQREQEILENIDALPANTKILKANFDEEKELRKKYGVTTKDTFIFVDGTGEFTLKNGASVSTIETFFVDQTVTPGEERPDGLGGYFDYDPAVVETFKGNKPYAFFFHASWCPTCVATDKLIKENLATLPKNTNVFKIDYDSNKDLRKEFSVLRQDTFVFFDKDGNPVGSPRNGVGLAELTEYFQ